MSYRWSPLPHWPAAQAEASPGASSVGGRPALLDAASLDRLRELDPGGRNGLLQRVLRTYTQSLDRLLVQWRAARAARDDNALRVIAHTLKSSSASVGALELSALCAEVEARGAEIVQEPIDQDYGLRDCAFRGPAGNLIRLQQRV